MVSALLAQPPDLLPRAFAILVTSLVTCAVITLAASLYIAYLDWRNRERERHEARASHRVSKAHAHARRDTARGMVVAVDDGVKMEACDDADEDDHVQGAYDEPKVHVAHTVLEVGWPQDREHVGGEINLDDLRRNLELGEGDHPDQDERIWTF